ncbi:hypothetical protein SFMTTN_2694 [Sulfuriferula multivorans]|uniref:Uncharacterized protein n=1 Tax=Sulfuriferula multivorans TaxID=1559896 RepID=A0A401JGY1_9PROT|nr:hypothetical protein SFMTTN_2694 [Sulfuriferula multivorans]
MATLDLFSLFTPHSYSRTKGVSFDLFFLLNTKINEEVECYRHHPQAVQPS